MEKYDPVAEILRLQHIINSNYVIDSLRNEPKIQEYIHIAHNIRENMQSYLKPFNRQIYNIRQELDKLNAHYSAYFGKPLTYQDILFLLEQVRKEIAEQAKIEINEQEIQEIADVLQGGKSEQAISETVKTFLVWFLRVFIPILCTITGYSVKDYIALLMPTPKELICQEYHVYNAKNAEIRRYLFVNIQGKKAKYWLNCQMVSEFVLSINLKAINAGCKFVSKMTTGKLLPAMLKQG